MRNVSGQFRHVCQLVSTLLSLIADAVYYLGLCLCPSPRLAAENLFLRKQLALYQERQVRPRRATNATRMALIWLGQWFDWRRALGIVKPETFIAWHRQGFRLFWRWKSHIPSDLVVNRWARDGESGSHRDILCRLDVWTLARRQISWKITSVLSMVWYFTT